MYHQETVLSLTFRLRHKETGEFLRYYHSNPANSYDSYFFCLDQGEPIYEVSTWATAFIALNHNPSAYCSSDSHPCHLTRSRMEKYEVVAINKQSHVQIKKVISDICFLSFAEHFVCATTYKRNTVLIVKKESNLKVGDVLNRSYQYERIASIIPMPKDMRAGYSGKEKEGMRIAYLEKVPDNFSPDLELVPASSLTELELEAEELKRDGKEIINRLQQIQQLTLPGADHTNTSQEIQETLKVLDEQLFQWRVEVQAYADQTQRAIAQTYQDQTQ